MRWKLSLAVPVVFVLFLATDSNAQKVPVTVTLAAENQAVSAVQFPDIIPEPGQTAPIFERPATGRVQHLVGILGQTGGIYKTAIRYRTGGHWHSSKIIFEKEGTCEETGTTGRVEVIACAVVEHGAGLVCSAVYENMESPPNTCTGTYACIRCGNVKVCGSNPQCQN